MVSSTQSLHSEIAPSSASIWVPCPGSVMMSRGVPDEETDSNREGTAAHEIAADALKGCGYPVEMNRTMREAVGEYVKDVETHRKGDLYVEQCIECPNIHAKSFGTADAYDISFDRLLVWDFKYGYRQVSAYNNWQLINYAAGILAQNHGLRHVEFRIVQPRAYNSSGPSVWRTTVDVLEPFIEQMRQSAAEAFTQWARCCPGLHCRDCLGRHKCTALGYDISMIVDSKHLPVNLEMDNIAIGRELTLLHRDVKMLKYRIDSLEQRAIATINDGLPIPGYTVMGSHGRLAWDRTPEEIVELGKLFKVVLGKGASVVTPTQAIKAGVPEDVVKGYASRPDNGVKLVEATGGEIFNQ